MKDEKYIPPIEEFQILFGADIVKPRNFRPVRAYAYQHIKPQGKLKRISFVGSPNKLYIDDKNDLFSVWFNDESKKAEYIFQYNMMPE